MPKKKSSATAADPFGFSKCRVPASAFGKGDHDAKIASRVGRAAAMKKKEPKKKAAATRGVDLDFLSPRQPAASTPKTSTPMSRGAAAVAGMRGARSGSGLRLGAAAAAITSTPIAGKENGGRRSGRSSRAEARAATAMTVEVPGGTVVPAPSPLDVSGIRAIDASAIDASVVYDMADSSPAPACRPSSRAGYGTAGKKGGGRGRAKRRSAPSPRTWNPKLEFSASSPQVGQQPKKADPTWSKTKEAALAKMREQFAAIDNFSFEEELV